MTLNTMLENYKKFEEIKNAFIFMLKSESYKEIYHTINNLEWNFGQQGEDVEIIRVFITEGFVIDIAKLHFDTGINRIEIQVNYKEYSSYHEQIKDNVENIVNVFDLFRLR